MSPNINPLKVSGTNQVTHRLLEPIPSGPVSRYILVTHSLDEDAGWVVCTPAPAIDAPDRLQERFDEFNGEGRSAEIAYHSVEVIHKMPPGMWLHKVGVLRTYQAGQLASLNGFTKNLTCYFC